MQKITRTNLNNKLASKSKSSQKARNSKLLFSQRRLFNLGLRHSVTETVEFLERVNIKESLVQIGTVTGFRGIRGDIYIKAAKPFWRLFSSRGENSGIFDRLAVFFQLENIYLIFSLSILIF